MLIQVTPSDVREQLFFECRLDDSTELVTKTALQLHNYLQYLRAVQGAIRDLVAHGQLRAPEARGLAECVGDETFGPDRDASLYRDGFKPQGRAAELLRECCADVERICTAAPGARTPLTLAGLDEVLSKVKGSVMIGWPEGLRPHEALRELLEARDDHVAGRAGVDGTVDVDAGAVFFAGKPLLRRGETMRCLGAPDSSLVKLIPARSENYAPRSHGDRSNAELMRILYDREQARKKAELMTEDDVYGRDWADDGALKKQMQGIGDIRFK